MISPWAPPLRVSQKALSLCLRRLPLAPFGQLFAELAPALLARAEARR